MADRSMSVLITLIIIDIGRVIIVIDIDNDDIRVITICPAVMFAAKVIV